MQKQKNIIFEVCKNANISYLNGILSKVNNTEKKSLIINLFKEHMLQMSNLCINDFLIKDVLTQDFIKELHKFHFPPGYEKTKPTLSGDVLVVVMTPGVYKTGHTNYN